MWSSASAIWATSCRRAERSAAYFDKFYKDEVALWAKVLGGLEKN